MATTPPGIVGLPFAKDKDSPQPSRGIFGEFPGATPKYAKNDGTVDPDFRESLARLFIQVSAGEWQSFVDSVAADDANTAPLARVLAGTNVAVSDPNTGGAGYIDFLLQSAQHSLREKAEVVETLADNYVAYFFGQAAPTFSYSGTLVNTKQDDQAINMYRIYRDIIRGTQLARRKKVVRLKYNGTIVCGTTLGLDWQLSADNETAVPFSFQILVKSITLLPNAGYGIVVLSDPFADSQVLPALSNNVAPPPPPGSRPLQVSVAPPTRSSTVVNTMNNSVVSPAPTPSSTTPAPAPQSRDILNDVLKL